MEKNGYVNPIFAEMLAAVPEKLGVRASAPLQ